MVQDLIGNKPLSELEIGCSEVFNPDGGINQEHVSGGPWLGGRAAAGDVGDVWLGAAEGCESAGCFAGDERFESCADEGGLFLNPREFAAALDEVIINDQGGSHMY